VTSLNFLRFLHEEKRALTVSGRSSWACKEISSSKGQCLANADKSASALTTQVYCRLTFLRCLLFKNGEKNLKIRLETFVRLKIQAFKVWMIPGEGDEEPAEGGGQEVAEPQAQVPQTLYVRDDVFAETGKLLVSRPPRLLNDRKVQPY